jgi:cytochrome bd-type quinol oxidase subunit 2
MIEALILFLVPTLLFVLAFLYETFLAFRRLGSSKAGRSGYVVATWEVTHTLLVFAVVMLVMLFTQAIDQLASAIFVATFSAAVALGLRAVFYLYIFYVRRSSAKTSWVDWVFALTHVAAALLLVVVVLQALVFLLQNNPPANTQFYPAYIPGLILVLAVCAVPIFSLYRTRN